MPADLTDVSEAAYEANQWTRERDNRIRVALRDGASLRTVADAAGLSHAAIARIRDR